MRCVFLILLSTPLFGLDLAKYNKKTVTDQELKDLVKRIGGRQGDSLKSSEQQQKQVVESIIVRNLIVDKATAEKVDKTAEFQKMVEGTKRDILANFYLEQAVKKKTNPKAMQDYFNKNKANFAAREDQVKASHILFKLEPKKPNPLLKGKDQKDLKLTDKEIAEVKKRAEKVLALAKSGKDFAALAKQYSEGPTKSVGGDLGYFGKKRMVKEFADVAFATKKGQLHPKLVKSQFGFHIIKVMDSIKKGDASYEMNKDRVKGMFGSSVRKEIIDGIKKTAKIQILDDNFKKIKF